MSDLTPWERARLWETIEREEMTRPARATFLRRFDREADPDGTLAPEERARRVKEARRAYFTELGRRSAEVRWGRVRRMRAAAEGAAKTDEEVPLDAEPAAEPEPAMSETSPWDGFTGRLF